MAIAISSKSKTGKKSASRTAAANKNFEQSEFPTEDEVRILAFELYERRLADGTEGDATSDWTQAERQLSEIDELD